MRLHDQVTDYALDLKHFHESSHERHIAPILIATHAPGVAVSVALTQHKDKLFSPIRSNGQSLGEIIREVHDFIGDFPSIDGTSWVQGSYRPTPTIIEAAAALYNGHAVAEISRSDAGGAELHRTTQRIGDLIADARANSYKAICFVTGVPGIPPSAETLIDITDDSEIREVSDVSFRSGGDQLPPSNQVGFLRSLVRTARLASKNLSLV